MGVKDDLHYRLTAKMLVEWNVPPQDPRYDAVMQRLLTRRGIVDGSVAVHRLFELDDSGTLLWYLAETSDHPHSVMTDRRVGESTAAMVDDALTQLSMLLGRKGSDGRVGRAILDGLLGPHDEGRIAAWRVLVHREMGLAEDGLREGLDATLQAAPPDAPERVIRAAVLRRCRMISAIDFACRMTVAVLVCCAGVAMFALSRQLWPALGKVLILVALPVLASLFLTLMSRPALKVVRGWERKLLDTHREAAVVRNRLRDVIIGDANGTFGGTPKVLSSIIRRPDRSNWMRTALDFTDAASPDVIRDVIRTLRVGDVEWSVRERVFRWLHGVVISG